MSLLNHFIAIIISAQRFIAFKVFSLINVQLVHCVVISCPISWLTSMFTVVMVTLFTKQAMAMRISSMEHLIHDNVDDQSSTCGDEHHKWSLNVLAGYDPFSGLEDHKKEEHIDDEKIREGTEQFHSMISKSHFRGGFFFRKIEEEEAEDEANQISDEMNGIRYDSDGVGDDSCCNLAAYEDKGD